MANGVVETRPSLPATSTVNAKVPVAVGVPLSEPALLKVNPAGKAPEKTDHV